MTIQIEGVPEGTEVSQEWRGIIRGWKSQPENTFVDYQTLFTVEDALAWVKRQSERVDADVRSPHVPHITEVTLLTRFVTEFVEVGAE